MRLALPAAHVFTLAVIIEEARRWTALDVGLGRAFSSDDVWQIAARPGARIFSGESCSTSVDCAQRRSHLAGCTRRPLQLGIAPSLLLGLNDDRGSQSMGEREHDGEEEARESSGMATHDACVVLGCRVPFFTAWCCPMQRGTRERDRERRMRGNFAAASRLRTIISTRFSSGPQPYIAHGMRCFPC